MTLPVFAAETILVLAERAGDEVRGCGALIAALCRAGRPPFVVVLSDGPAPGPGADRLVRDGLARLGLDGRMLMFGLAGAVPRTGPVFEAAVRAVCFVSWRHDCNLLLAPSGDSSAGAIAAAAAAASGLGLASYGAEGFRRLAESRPSA